MKCICFLRPSSDAIQLLIDELRNPKYGEYLLCLYSQSSKGVQADKANILLKDFSNIVKKSSLERLAEADEHEVVQTVQEVFADYMIINPDLFALNFTTSGPRIWSQSPDQWNFDALTRTTEAVLAALLTLKKKPLIRYEKNSGMAKKAS